MSAHRRVKRARKLEHRRGALLELVRVEPAALERVELPAIARAAIFDLYRMHDDPRVSEAQMLERWARWMPALVEDLEPMQRFAFGWTVFKRSRPLITGRPAEFVEFIALVNGDAIGRALAGERGAA